MKNILLLAGSQALLLTNAVTLIAITALAGYALTDTKALATVPSTTYVIGAWLAALPASFWMRRVGRRNGFVTGAAFGVAGSAVASAAIAAGSFWALCVGTLLFGVYNAFGQYYRFAAADAASAEFRPKAISWVLAGGLVGGIVGPEVSKYTRDLVQPVYLASYASLAVFSLLAMALLAALRIPAPASEESHGPSRPLREIAAQPVFLVAVSVAGFGYATMTLLMTATPLAMGFCGHPYSAAASVIAAHVVAMFAPSFVTGSLIGRFGVVAVMAAGLTLLFACIAIGLAGQQVAHFWWALVLLGVGWNFTYIGGTALLTEAYRPSEKAKVQGVNEMAIYTVQAAAALSSGVLVDTRGWETLNHVALALVAIPAAALAWLRFQRRGAAARAA